ncbi:glycosyltransferase family 4 protein [Deinococcus sp. A31D244]|uniref:glycosyltransferase family 4 protein n=1 Tax=Deinococcus sp. A31D244 TaxID=3397675 RepID=UPI0039DF5677
MKILYVGHAYMVTNGHKKFSYLSEMRHEVSVIRPHKWYAPAWSRTLMPEPMPSGIRSREIKVFFEGKSGGYFYSPFVLLREVKLLKPDVIVIEQETFSISAFQISILAKLLKIPYITFSWENIKKDLGWRKWTNRIVVTNAAGAIAGNSAAAKIVQNDGFEGNVEVITQFGVDDSSFFPNENDKSESIAKFVYIGRLVEEKGIKSMINAFISLNEKNATLDIVGGGPLENYIRDIAQEYPQINFLGPVRHQEVPEVIRQYDILILPSIGSDSWDEQFGLVLAQAMLSGLAVIGSDNGAIPDVIQDKELLFRSGSEIEISERIKALLDAEYRKTKAKDLFIRAKREYTCYSVAKKSESYIKEVLE